MADSEYHGISMIVIIITFNPRLPRVDVNGLIKWTQTGVELKEGVGGAFMSPRDAALEFFSPQ